METPILDISALVQPAINAVSGGVADVAGPALLVGGAILALRVGWGFAKGFVRG